MKILLTGAAGHIGSALAFGLKDHYELYLADIKSIEEVSGKGAIYQSNRYFSVNLSDRDEVARLFETLPSLDVLLHFSASWRSIDEILRTMIVQTTYLTEAALDHGVTKYIYASSGAAVEFYEIQAIKEGRPFHLQKHPPVVDETMQPRAPNHYGLAKIWMEYHARMLSDSRGIKTIGLRIGNFTTKADLSDLNEKQKKRAFLADDAVSLVKSCIENDDITCEIFNAISWPPGSEGVSYDTSKAQSMLGYNPSLR